MDRDGGFPATLKRARARAGLTQAELADRVGVTRRTLVDWEAGRSFPRATHWVAVERALNERARTSG